MPYKIPNTWTYPDNYVKIHQPNIDEPFIGTCINKQTVICDPKSGSRKTTITYRRKPNLDHIQTMKDLFEHGLQISRTDPCLGYRNSLDEEFQWRTYAQVDELIHVVGRALLKKFGQDSTNMIGIYGPNSFEWIITQYACFFYSYTVVPLYATLGDKSVQHVLKQTEMTIVMCGTIENAISLLKNFESNLKCVIIPTSEEALTDIRQQYSTRVEIITFEKFSEIGKGYNVPKHIPSPTDLCLICYTSGSTGLPKGVMITHEQLAGTVLSASESANEMLYCKNSVHLSYLPLPHIMEQLFVALIFLYGGRTGFLTKSIVNLLPDLQALKPTVLVCVPRVLYRMYSNYMSVINKSPLKSLLFRYVYNRNKKELERGKFNHTDFLSRLVFDKIRSAVGGRVCVLISGGAPLSDAVSNFARVAFNAFFVSGYGLTEATGVINLTLIGDNQTSIAGIPNIGVEIKLVDVPSLGLCSLKDNKGEICVKGKRCTQGYYKDPEKTADLIDEDGWLHTGDIGEWTENGCLRITDRLKSIFKLSQGEYIAPENVELVYLTNVLINQLVIDGDALHNYPVAIVVPNFQNLRDEFKQSMNNTAAYDQLSDEELCKLNEVKQFLLKTLNQSEHIRGLKGFEKLKSIHLTNEQFTVENGLLTPTQKVARLYARRHFSPVFKQLYKDGPIV